MVVPHDIVVIYNIGKSVAEYLEKYNRVLMLLEKLSLFAAS